MNEEYKEFRDLVWAMDSAETISPQTKWESLIRAINQVDLHGSKDPSISGVTEALKEQMRDRVDYLCKIFGPSQDELKEKENEEILTLKNRCEEYYGRADEFERRFWKVSSELRQYKDLFERIKQLSDE